MRTMCSSRDIAPFELTLLPSDALCGRVAHKPARFVPAQPRRSCSSRVRRTRIVCVLFVMLFFQAGKQRPKASSRRGEPCMRIFLRTKAHTRLASLRRKESHILLSAVTRKSAVPK